MLLHKNEIACTRIGIRAAFLDAGPITPSMRVSHTTIGGKMLVVGTHCALNYVLIRYARRVASNFVNN